VGAHSSFSIGDPDRCLAGANPLAPDLMTADERLTEVAQILAAGSCVSDSAKSGTSAIG
jgi:hypothetical protein